MGDSQPAANADASPNEELGAEGVSSLTESLPADIPSERYDLRVFRAVRKIIRFTDRYSKRLVAEHGVTVPQLVCLLKVVESGPIPIRKIAEEVFLSPSTLVGIIDRLEKQRLVRRMRHPTDRRLVMVEATGEGRELARRSPSPLQDTLAEALKHVPTAEQAIIAQSLERIVELMEIKKVDAAPILETTEDLTVLTEAGP